MSVRLTERGRMPSHPTESIVRSARRMLAILVGMARTRLNLLAIEIMQEKSRIWLLLILTALLMLFSFMALLTLSLFVVVAFWNDNRLLAIGCVFAFYVCAALVSLVVLRRKARLGSSLFSGTLEVLGKDAAALEDEIEEVEADFSRRNGDD